MRRIRDMRGIFLAADGSLLSLLKSGAPPITTMAAMELLQDSLTLPGPRETVSRMLYASRARVQESIYATLESIRAAAMRHNEPAGVHTALLYQSGWFLQWKEGPTGPLRRIMGRVATDPRHHQLFVVHSSRGPRLLHGPWSMAIVQSDETPEALGARVMQLRDALMKGRQYSPTSALRRVASPALLGGTRPVEPESYHRVLVCSAQGTDAFELVRWLAARERKQVIHRRYAGAQDLDVATDYFDVERHDRLLRVVAMARKGLKLPLTRAMLADYSHVVLLLCGDPELDLAMLLRLAQACERLDRRPCAVGVGTDFQMHEVLAALARRFSIDYLPAAGPPRDPARTWQVLQPLLQAWSNPEVVGLPVEPVPSVW